MATETKANPIAQFGPIGAPALGGVLLVVFVSVVYFGGDISGQQSTLEKSISSVNERRNKNTPMLPPATLPSVTSVIDMTTPDDRAEYSAIAGEAKLANLPVLVKVNVQDRVLNEFEEYDVDPKDERWSEKEFRATPYPSTTGKTKDFKNWDRDGSKFIERKEYDDPPVEDDERFRQLDKNEDNSLTAPDEISSEDLLAWDENFDDKVSLQEFKDRYKPKEWVDLGPVKSVGATVDPEKMEIVITWETPELTTVPPDIAYLIERYSPETVEQRKKDYGKRVARYTKELEAWEKAFDAWWNSATDAEDDGEKKNKDIITDKNKAMAAFAQIKPKPVMPAQPTEWEEVTVATGNEYRDASFETDATYTYAVRVLTGKPLKRGVKADGKYGERVQSVRVVQPTHPVRVPNRIVMAWDGTAGSSAVNIKLTKWLRYDDGTTMGWYRVTVTESVDSNTNPNLGGEYTANQIKDRRGSAFKAGETSPADVPTILAGGKLDFRTGYRFVTNTGAGAILTHAELGDFELPKGTKPAMPAQAAPGTDATLEVRVLSCNNWGKTSMDATFELTRWHKVGEKWYRVVMVRKRVKNGADIGATVDFGAGAEGVTIYDTTGAVLTTAAAKALNGGSVDLNIGKFEGATSDERATVKVNGETMDLFGTMYK